MQGTQAAFIKDLLKAYAASELTKCHSWKLHVFEMPHVPFLLLYPNEDVRSSAGFFASSRDLLFGSG